MIRAFEPPHPLEPETEFQWGAACGAGALAGVILLITPRGSPWSALTFFSPTIMGRVVPPEMGMSLFTIYLIHMVLAVVYGLVIGWVASGVHQLRAVLAGGIVGLVLYMINLGVVSTWLPQLRGYEFSVVVTHFVFGLIAGGAYRGLLRRKPESIAAPS